MTKKLLAVVVVLSLTMVSLSASADDTTATQAVKVYTLKPTTVYGKRQLPSVVIEIARLSAAHEASAAHDHLHNALVESSVPATLRTQ